MLESGIDSLIHGISHLERYNYEKKIKDLRFALISIDNAFELLIKKCLIDKQILVFKSWKTKSVLDGLAEIRKQIENSRLAYSEKNDLKPFIFHNELIILHNYRNDTYHIGSITKEEQLIEILNDVLKSVKPFLKIFFNINISQLDTYLMSLTVEVFPLDDGYNQLLDKRGKISDKEFFLQAYPLLKTIIVHSSNHLFGEKKTYSYPDLIEVINKFKKIKELENTFLKNMMPTIIEKFSHVKDIWELATSDFPVAEELISNSFADLFSSFSFFIEIYRLIEMGFIKV